MVSLQAVTVSPDQIPRLDLPNIAHFDTIKKIYFNELNFSLPFESQDKGYDSISSIERVNKLIKFRDWLFQLGDCTITFQLDQFLQFLYVSNHMFKRDLKYRLYRSANGSEKNRYTCGTNYDNEEADITSHGTEGPRQKKQKRNKIPIVSKCDTTYIFELMYVQSNDKESSAASDDKHDDRKVKNGIAKILFKVTKKGKCKHGFEDFFKRRTNFFYDNIIKAKMELYGSMNKLSDFQKELTLFFDNKRLKDGFDDDAYTHIKYDRIRYFSQSFRKELTLRENKTYMNFEDELRANLLYIEQQNQQGKSTLSSDFIVKSFTFTKDNDHQNKDSIMSPSENNAPGSNELENHQGLIVIDTSLIKELLQKELIITDLIDNVMYSLSSNYLMIGFSDELGNTVPVVTAVFPANDVSKAISSVFQSLDSTIRELNDFTDNYDIWKNLKFVLIPRSGEILKSTLFHFDKRIYVFIAAYNAKSIPSELKIPIDLQSGKTLLGASIGDELDGFDGHKYIAMMAFQEHSRLERLYDKSLNLHMNRVCYISPKSHDFYCLGTFDNALELLRILGSLRYDLPSKLLKRKELHDGFGNTVNDNLFLLIRRIFALNKNKKQKFLQLKSQKETGQFKALCDEFILMKKIPLEIQKKLLAEYQRAMKFYYEFKTSQEGELFKLNMDRTNNFKKCSLDQNNYVFGKTQHYENADLQLNEIIEYFLAGRQTDFEGIPKTPHEMNDTNQRGMSNLHEKSCYFTEKHKLPCVHLFFEYLLYRNNEEKRNIVKMTIHEQLVKYIIHLQYGRDGEIGGFVNPSEEHVYSALSYGAEELVDTPLPSATPGTALFEAFNQYYMEQQIVQQPEQVVINEQQVQVVKQPVQVQPNIDITNELSKVINTGLEVFQRVNDEIGVRDLNAIVNIYFPHVIKSLVEARSQNKRLKDFNFNVE